MFFRRFMHTASRSRVRVQNRVPVGRVKNVPQLISFGKTALGRFPNRSPSELMIQAIERALAMADVPVSALSGLVCAGVPLAEPRFMFGHFLATEMGMLPHADVVVKTIDTGGASPISGMLEACRMVTDQQLDLVAVVSGDCVLSLSTESFLKRADAGSGAYDLASPKIPTGYDRVAQWHMDAYGVTREQLAMCSVLMSRQAQRHPDALSRKDGSCYPETTLDDVLNAPTVGEAVVTSRYECAKRADGAACILIASSRWMKAVGLRPGVTVVAGAEASGPLHPPRVIDESMFSCDNASYLAFEEAQLSTEDIDFFGLYDCFPITLIRAVEAVGLCSRGQGGSYIQELYDLTSANPDYRPSDVPINTHGGLLGFGAPWEAPAMFSVIEAFEQLTGTAGSRRQIPDARRGLVYGNGGIFSHSAVGLLSRMPNDGHGLPPPVGSA